MTRAVWRLVLVRHGETLHSVERRWSGHNEEALSEEGRRMAACLAARLAGAEVSGFYVSPLRRARETAGPIATALGREPVVEPALAECDFGRWDGLRFAEAGERDPEALARWLAGEGPAGETGERLGEMAERVERWMDAALAAHPGGTVLAVTHSGPIKCALRRALGVEFGIVYRMQQDLASISIVERAAGAWWVRASNDTMHLLDGAALPPPGRRPFG